MSLPAVALAFVRALPASAAVVVARLLVLSYLALRPDYRAEIRRNYRLIAGRDRPWFWLRNGWRIGRNLALMARVGTRMGDGFVDSARVCGENLTTRPLEQELHRVMVSFHFGAWEYLPQVFARLGWRVTLAVGSQRDVALRRRVDRLRRVPGVTLARSLRDVAGRHPGITGFVLDNTSQGHQESVRVEGLALRVPVLPFRLAESSVGVVPAFCRFERGRLVIDVGRPGGREECVRALVAAVRANPEEWVFWAKGGALAA